MTQGHLKGNTILFILHFGAQFLTQVSLASCRNVDSWLRRWLALCIVAAIGKFNKKKTIQKVGFKVAELWAVV